MKTLNSSKKGLIIAKPDRLLSRLSSGSPILLTLYLKRRYQYFQKSEDIIS
jgi:hypothetical protein